jgi:hypothetical protein
VSLQEWFNLIKQLPLPTLIFIFSTLSLNFTFASPVPVPHLERRVPFTLYDPNGGDRLFSDDGTTRTITEQNDTAVEDVEPVKLEHHIDMVELVRRYAPIFKLSYVPLS